MHEPSFPLIGDIFVDRYKIERVIGTGGFARVYRATQTDLGRDVAIKVLKPVTDPTKSAAERQAKFAQVSKRFEREAKLISRLKDRNTVMMYDYGTTPDGLLFMVLEYVGGTTVGEMLFEHGALEPERVVKILRQALTSLHEAHSLGILHRDIKPANIMVYEHVGREDQVKVLDFGIAKTVDSASDDASLALTTSSDVTADGVLVGTPRYMSPEQIRGKTLGPGSDLYSLGLVTYELLIGTKAVQADSSLNIIARHLDTDPIALPEDLPLPPKLRHIVNTMLEKDPAERYQACGEVLRDLEDWEEVGQANPGYDPTYTVEGPESIEAEQSEKKTTLPAVAVAVVTFGIVAMLAIPIFTGESESPEASVRDAVANPTENPTGHEPSSESTPSEEEANSEVAHAAQGKAATVDPVVVNTNEPDPDDSETEESASDEPAAEDENADEAPKAEAAGTEEKTEPEKSRPKKRRTRRRRKPRKRKSAKSDKVDSKSGFKIFAVE